MSNEELVSLIQAGETERMGELWEQVAGLVKWKANRLLTALELRGNPCGVVFDDLYQSGYIAMVEAVHYYTPENGAAFSTCLMNRLKTVFAELTGYRTKTGRNEPLNNCFSLDKTVDDESDGATFGELAPDPAATAQFQNVEEKLWHKQLQEAMEAALLALPDNQRQCLQMLYWQEKTLQEAAEVYGVSYERIRQIEAKALRVLRQPKNACNLLPFYQCDFYAHTGLTAFQQSGMSAPERYVITMEERQARTEQRWKEQETKKFKKQCAEMMAQIDREVREQVARMTSEEKRALLEKYGA